jgi:hypothetical protein
MTDRPNDALLRFGKVLALIIQGLCALGGAIALLLIPVLILASQNMLPGSLGADGSSITGQSLPVVLAIPLLMAVSLAALFRFFGKMRTIIVSASEGDPFIPENAGHLNAMGWLLLVHEVVALLVGELRVYTANLVDEQAGNTIEYSPYDLDGVLLVIVLFILARVFRHGAAMREDLQGTV